jgi:glutathione synthase/RimK-type ligase-like ATP-grasp enzyme
MVFDIVVLTDPRYISPEKRSPYIDNVLLEDRLVVEALQAEGLKVVRKSWDDAHFDWSSTKLALFRTTWDYFDRFPEFSKWFENTSKLTRFINSKELITWNIDKHYLQDLSRAGVTIPKTIFVEKGTQATLQALFSTAVHGHGFRKDQFILKPCVSGAARHTYRINTNEISKYEDLFGQLISEEAMMLQEFQENIVSEGEISMMLFHGEFTHAVLKIAKPGDFRVQDDFGGSVHEYTPSKEQIAFAEKVVGAAPELPVYARVDMFRDNEGNWALAELEIFEPELWFRRNPSAAQKLAKTIKDTCLSIQIQAIGITHNDN